VSEPKRPDRSGSFLSGVRVLEVADELGEYCGKLLAGLGADVIKVEPPGGEITRTYGPFYENVPGPDRSLYFWHYNLGKLGVTIDLDDPAGQEEFRRLATSCDVVIDTRRLGWAEQRGIGYDALHAINPALLYLRLSPFGDDGPWAGYAGCDLVHLSLGGVAMNCGYDPEPNGVYDLPPIAPQMWQSYHIAGEMAALGVLGALLSRLQGTGGQQLSVSVHDAVAKNTETDLPNWVYLRQTHYRRTCRHSLPIKTVTQLSASKDGRWLLPYRSYLPGILDGWDGTIRLLDKYGFAEDFTSDAYNDPKKRAELATRERLGYLTDELVGSLRFDRGLWLDAQAEGLPWAPLRLPEENIDDEHWQRRETFLDVEHPELGRSFTYVGAKWLAPEVPWVQGPRAPLVGEHNTEVLASSAAPRPEATAAPGFPVGKGALSELGKPFALTGVRVVDLAWLLASAGAGRYLAAMGAEVIKVEHKSRWDAMRWGAGAAPTGGRAERDAATGPITPPPPSSPNRGGAFFEFNSGKLGISLNLKHPRGREILERLIRDADMVVEGFSPGTMERMGLGYDRLKEINPRIIYVQQSGMGQIGTYGSARSFGPTAAALAGLSEMSGLPAPYAPAGIGYSYLDWFGAYNMAVAMTAALYRQARTGKGCYIDSSQVESGTYLAGTAVLNYTVNGEHWQRYGNRSPYKPAAPHGIYRTKGEDRWIAIGCFSQEQWQAAVSVLGHPELADDPRFADLSARLAHQDVLDAAMAECTEGTEGYQLMDALQKAGVPAGVCQTAEDRCDNDPQLAHLQWLVELDQSEIGRWPVKEFPVKFSETPAYIGGIHNKSGPSYGQDNEYVYGSILGLSPEEIKQLTDDDAF
jgi:crotonobetainyl-CoA:carnitine CoA-transferase CaiB-like acyl-CoA transferase